MFTPPCLIIDGLLAPCLFTVICEYSVAGVVVTYVASCAVAGVVVLDALIADCITVTVAVLYLILEPAIAAVAVVVRLAPFEVDPVLCVLGEPEPITVYLLGCLP